MVVSEKKIIKCVSMILYIICLLLGFLQYNIIFERLVAEKIIVPDFLCHIFCVST